MCTGVKGLSCLVLVLVFHTGLFPLLDCCAVTVRVVEEDEP